MSQRAGRLTALRSSVAFRGVKGLTSAIKIPRLGGIALLGTVAIGVTIALHRLLTGVSLGTRGYEIRDFFFGDLDERARAAIAVRQQLARNPSVLRLLAKTDGKSSDVRRVFRSLLERKERELRGEDHILRGREFGVDSAFEQVVVRAKNAIVDSWNRAGGPEALNELERNYKALRRRVRGEGR